MQTLGDWPADLVITDLAMPHMNGIELCRRLREFSQIPIIVLSVRGEERAKVEALDCGADDYVTKPFGIEELLARIRATLRRAPTAAESQKSWKPATFDRPRNPPLTVQEKELHLTPKE